MEIEFAVGSIHAPFFTSFFCALRFFPFPQLKTNFSKFQVDLIGSLTLCTNNGTLCLKILQL